MNLPKICFVVALCSLFSTMVCARPLSEKYPSLYDNEWQKKLKLSPQQEAAVKQIKAENQKKMNVYLMEIDTIHHEMNALIDENNEQIHEVLSEKQKTKYDMYQYQQKKQNNEHKGEEKPSRKKMRVY